MAVTIMTAFPLERDYLGYINDEGSYVVSRWTPLRKLNMPIIGEYTHEISPPVHPLTVDGFRPDYGFTEAQLNDPEFMKLFDGIDITKGKYLF